jgi:antitoxin (DNA-binding transcriptional repressor) of toxin-antitoxin stability system
MPNIHETKTHLSKLVRRVEMGKEITISRAAKPVAKLVPHLGAPVRAPGILNGKIRIDDDFDAHDEEIADLFRAE